MEPWAQILLGGGLFLGVAGLVTAGATVWRNRSSDSQERFAQNIELSKYIDGKIALATNPLQERISGLETEINNLKERENATKNILRSFFQRLIFWDQNSRPGDMPMPSREDMEKLELDDLDTRDNTPSGDR